MVNGSAHYFKTTRELRDFNFNGDSFDQNDAYRLRIGYFISNNFVIGVKGDYFHSRNKYTYEPLNSPVTGYIRDQTVRNTGAGIFARYNFPIKGKLAIFLEMSGSYGKNVSSLTEITYIPYPSFATTSTLSNGINASLQSGIIYFISKRFSAEASFGNISYDHLFTKNPEDLKSNYFDANFSMATYYIGFSYYFGGNAHKDKTTTSPK